MTGGEESLTTWAGNKGDEIKKALFAMLLAGRPFTVVDNVSSNVDNDELAAILTTPTWESRMLGKPEAKTLRTNTMIFFTGNNVYPVGDMARRFCMCRINADVEDPERRTFDFSPHTLVRSDVLRYRVDTLTRVCQ